MEKNKEPTPESSSEEDFSGDISTTQNKHKELEDLFNAGEPEKSPNPENSKSISLELAEKLSKQLKDISSELKDCKEQISRLAQEAEDLKAAEKLVNDLSSRCRDLTEQAHEREVILPVIHCLIRMADDCRQQINYFQKVCAKNTDSKNESAIKAITFLIDTRKANLIEFENTLADLGVESYQHHQDTFEPSLQKCINRIESEKENLNTRIASRLLPGYRRYDKVIRKEYVNVYVLKNETDKTNNGVIKNVWN